MSATCQKVWLKTTIPLRSHDDPIAMFEAFRNYDMGDTSCSWVNRLRRIAAPSLGMLDEDRLFIYLDRAFKTLRSDDGDSSTVFGAYSGMSCGHFGDVPGQNGVGAIHFEWAGVGVYAMLLLDDSNKLVLRVTWEENEKQMNEQFIHDTFHGVL